MLTSGHRAHRLQPLTWSFSKVRASTTFCVARLMIVIESSPESFWQKLAACNGNLRLKKYKETVMNCTVCGFTGQDGSTPMFPSGR